MIKSMKFMYGYAGYLIALSFAAYALSGFQAPTALYFGGGAGILMIICAALAGMLPRNRTAGMIGIHAGLVLPLIFGLVFGWVAYRRFSVEDPVMYLVTILTLMSVGSFVAFVLILLTRPKPDQRV